MKFSLCLAFAQIISVTVRQNENTKNFIQIYIINDHINDTSLNTTLSVCTATLIYKKTNILRFLINFKFNIF